VTTTKVVRAFGAAVLLLLLCATSSRRNAGGGVLVHAFQPTAATSTTGATTTKPAAAPPNQQLPHPQHHTHEFWRQPRSHAEVEAHVRACLAGITMDGDNDAPPSTDVHVYSAEPPLVLIRDFLPPSLCRELVRTAQHQNKKTLQPSRTGAAQNRSASRTSTTVWLSDTDAPHPSRLVATKVAALTGLPAGHQENLQICRYRPTQEFQLHTDHQDNFNDLECRGRLATCLIYLGDGNSSSSQHEHEALVGGATHFPGVHDDDDHDDEIWVPPVAGAAVFFFNTLEKPGCPGYDAEMFLRTDLRMRHAGLPVERGEKWICNRWVHPIDMGVGVRGLSVSEEEIEEAEDCSSSSSSTTSTAE